MQTKNRKNQRGTTLIVALVMLIVLTLLVVSAIRSSSTNLRIAGNMQLQEEAIAAAQQGTEVVISSNFTASPAASSVIVTMGPATYTAAVEAPKCTGSKPLLSSDPSFTEKCRIGATLKDGLIEYESAPAATEQTLCLTQQWDIRTSVNDAPSGANTAIHQGVSLNVSLVTKCPI